VGRIRQGDPLPQKQARAIAVTDRGQAMKPIRRPFKSAIPKRSIIVGGKKTSISLEDEFWDALREIAKERQTTLQDLFTSINTGRRDANMSSAVRVFILAHFRNVKGPRITV
jgi:predicted DNA-binding ribbon-helix-helix protein